MSLADACCLLQKVVKLQVLALKHLKEYTNSICADVQNIKITLRAQEQNTKWINPQISKRLENIFSKEKYMNGQYAWKEVVGRPLGCACVQI